MTLHDSIVCRFSFLLLLFTHVIAATTNTTTPRQFFLVSKVKPGQAAGKKKFNNYVINVYHTTQNRISFRMSPYTDKGNVQELGSLYWLVEAGVSLRSPYNSPTSSPLSDLRVNATVPPLGWAFDFDADPYRYWEEPFFTSQNTTRKGGFYMDKDGLHFSFDASSGNASVVISKPKGWMLCDWAYEGPQIVVRQRSGKATPSTCADIWLMPRYKK